MTADPPSSPNLKNAIVFSVSGSRWAIELRWVREVITLGHTTPVPNAPPSIIAVVNSGGAIVPVLDLMPLLDLPRPAEDTANTAASAILLQVESVRAALRVDTIIEVTTLHHQEGNSYCDAAGARATLLDPQELVAHARAQVSNPIAERSQGEGRS